MHGGGNMTCEYSVSDSCSVGFKRERDNMSWSLFARNTGLQKECSVGIICRCMLRAPYMECHIWYSTMEFTTVP